MKVSAWNSRGRRGVEIKKDFIIINTFFHQNLNKMAIMKVIEVLAESEKSWEDATKTAIKKASDSVKHIRSAYVQSHSVTVEDGEVSKFRVNVKITFEVK